jgi:hypothetical protein
MQDGVDYPVIGVSSVARGVNAFLIQTGAGAAVLKPTDRFRVLEGGNYSTATIAVTDISVTTEESGWTVWRGIISSPSDLGQVYGAFQWYDVDGKPVQTTVQLIGALEANKPLSISFILTNVPEGTYSVHFWSANGELRQGTKTDW